MVSAVSTFLRIVSHIWQQLLSAAFHGIHVQLAVGELLQTNDPTSVSWFHMLNSS